MPPKVVEVGRIVVHTTSTQIVGGSTKLYIYFEGDHRYKSDMSLNTARSIAVAPGTYTAVASVLEYLEPWRKAECPKQSVKAERGKPVDIFYLITVVKSANSYYFSCSLPPR